MEYYTYRVNNDVELKIYLPNKQHHYLVEHDGEQIGYIYVSATDFETGEPVWLGSTEELSLVAGTIGDFIEKMDK